MEFLSRDKNGTANCLVPFSEAVIFPDSGGHWWKFENNKSILGTVVVIAKRAPCVRSTRVRIQFGVEVFLYNEKRINISISATAKNKEISLVYLLFSLGKEALFTFHSEEICEAIQSCLQARLEKAFSDPSGKASVSEQNK